MSAPQTTEGQASRRAASAALPRWLRYWLAGTGLVLCLAILALWGLHGPSYILDLVTAYCF
jgi:hypothetical protein